MRLLPHVWTEAEFLKIGTDTDARIAQVFGVSRATIRRKRIEMGKPSHKLFNDLSGQRFGQLIVLELANRQRMDAAGGGYTRLFWRCLCSCGKIVCRPGTNLADGRIKSCGHIRKRLKRHRC